MAPKSQPEADVLFGVLLVHFLVSIALSLWIATALFPNNGPVVVAVIAYQFVMHIGGITAVLKLLEIAP